MDKKAAVNFLMGGPFLLCIYPPTLSRCPPPNPVPSMSPTAEASVEKHNLLLGVKSSKESISGECDPFDRTVALAEARMLLTLNGGCPHVFFLSPGQGLWPIPSSYAADGCDPGSARHWLSSNVGRTQLLFQAHFFQSPCPGPTLPLS